MIAMKDYLTLAKENQEKAWSIIRDAQIIEAWRGAGAEINLVGSLKLGLLMKHRDIDFHVYSQDLTLEKSFAAVMQIAACPRIRKMEYTNLLDTSEACIEWHLWYEDDEALLWQIDMIHMPKGSAYDGYFERVAERIAAVLTEETRDAILRLKYETPDTEKIMGIEYYQAVIEGGVRTYAELTEWRKQHPVDGIVTWMPSETLRHASGAEFYVIDKSTWERAVYFDYYYSRIKCKYTLNANLDITHLVEGQKQRGFKFFPVMLYVIMRAVNRNKEFRMSFNEKGELGYWEYVVPSYTLFHNETKTFTDVWSDYSDDFDTFYQTVVADIRTYGNITGVIKARPDQPRNFCPVSSLPWLSFTGFAQDTYAESSLLFPLIKFGKYFQEGGKILLPVAVFVSHAVADGYHTCKLINDMQEIAQSLWKEV